jgi:hypothetical protein
MKLVDRSAVYRLTASILLAAVAVALFILNREESKSPEGLQQEFTRSAQSIDKEIDVILEGFGVQKAWIKKREIAVSGEGFARIERRVLIPPTIVPVLINREFNLLAQRFRGRAVATENLKENTVTIHILLHQSIIQTIILKYHTETPAKGRREQRKQV